MNRIQQIRKSKGLEVTDHVKVRIQRQEDVDSAVHQFKSYICTEILADDLVLADTLNGDAETVEIDENNILIEVNKI